MARSRLAGCESIPSRPAGPDSAAFLGGTTSPVPCPGPGGMRKRHRLLRARLLKTRSPVPTSGPKFGCFSPVEQRVPSRHLGWRQAEPCPTDQSPSRVPGRAECEKGTAYCVRGSLRQGVPSRPPGPKFGCLSPVEQRVPSPTRAGGRQSPALRINPVPCPRLGEMGKGTGLLRARLLKKESRPVSRRGGRRQVRLANGRTPNASPRTGFRQTTALGIGQGIPRFCARRNNPENCRWRPRS